MFSFFFFIFQPFALVLNLMQAAAAFEVFLLIADMLL